MTKYLLATWEGGGCVPPGATSGAVISARPWSGSDASPFSTQTSFETGGSSGCSRTVAMPPMSGR